MTGKPDILCIGSAVWDIIGRHPGPWARGEDQSGEITRQPGGVAMNLALTLSQFGLRPALLSALGHDRDGEEIINLCRSLALITDYAHRPDGLPTDRYMVIEDGATLFCAIADLRTLEACCTQLLAPLEDGRLGSAQAPWDGAVAVDGNLGEPMLAAMARNPALSRADLRLGPGSPAKAARLRALMTHPQATLYVNRDEAGRILGEAASDAAVAAVALRECGVPRVVVTDAGAAAAFGDAEGLLVRHPPQVRAVRVTGAGDTFMAAHIAAELQGKSRIESFESALRAAAAYAAGQKAPA